MPYKKIKFIPTNPFTEKVEIPPVNSSLLVPEWYKKTSPYSVNGVGHQDIIKAFKSSRDVYGKDVHTTMKLCQPFVDTLTSGYMIRLPISVMVLKNTDGSSTFRWETSNNPVDAQESQSLGHFKAPDGYNEISFRWINMWKIQTPSGYSSLFTHPFNRFDLPFITLSAIVDTDTHPNSVILPFFVKNDFEGIIEEGTPIAQVFPFKRDGWESEILPSDNSSLFAKDVVKTTFVRTYKKKFWSKKIYK